MAILGCIADDMTGATDLAGILSRGGLSTVQVNGVPDEEMARDEAVQQADALVVALKIRSVPAADACGQALASLDWLRGNGCSRFIYKYCSTFDSTPRGNIGPVTDALMDALGAAQTIFCPALPENGRTVYRGHLFVGDKLLSDTGMRHHPLNPMTDSNLLNVLGQQTRRPVGLIAEPVISSGPHAIRKRLEELREAGTPYAIADAISDRNLQDLVAGAAALPLITGGSGLALGLPGVLAAEGLASLRQDAAVAVPAGPSAVLSGSCSEATNRQVADMIADHESYQLDPAALLDGSGVDKAIDWACGNLGRKPVLLYATAAPDQVKAAQSRFGTEKVAEAIESAMGEIAKALVEAGLARLVVAGGETSGAVTTALGIRRLAIGREIAPGVPWTVGRPTFNSAGTGEIGIALKSGNFGGEQFFRDAFSILD